MRLQMLTTVKGRKHFVLFRLIFSLYFYSLFFIILMLKLFMDYEL